MELKEKIFAVIIFIVAVVASTFLVTLLSKKKQPDNIDVLINAKQEIINGLIRERDTYRQWKDETVSTLKRKDSVFVIQYKTNTIKYEKIPVAVGNYSYDELRLAVEEFR